MQKRIPFLGAVLALFLANMGLFSAGADDKAKFSAPSAKHPPAGAWWKRRRP